MGTRLGRTALVGVLALLGAAYGEPPETVTLVVRNVTVIDPASRQVLADQCVVVAGDRIRTVEPSGGLGPLDGEDRPRHFRADQPPEWTNVRQ